MDIGKRRDIKGQGRDYSIPDRGKAFCISLQAMHDQADKGFTQFPHHYLVLYESSDTRGQRVFLVPGKIYFAGEYGQGYGPRGAKHLAEDACHSFISWNSQPLLPVNAGAGIEDDDAAYRTCLTFGCDN